MGFFIDDIEERLEAHAVEVKKNGADFLVTSKNFHALIPGKELEAEYAVVSAASIENDKKAVESQIMQLEENKKNLELQIGQIEKEIEARHALLPHYEYFIGFLTNFVDTPGFK